MSSVLSLVQPVNENRKEDLLARLDELRVLLASGQVREIAYCCIHTDGAVSTMIAPSDDAFKMLGAMERMKMRFYDRNMDN